MNYNKTNIEDMKAHLRGVKKKQKKFDKDNKYDFCTLPLRKDKKCTIRVLPPKLPHQTIFKVVFRYHNLPGDDKNKKMVSLFQYDLHDPINAVLEQYKDILDVSDYGPFSRGYLNVLMLENEENPDQVDPNKPKILSAPTSFIEWLVEQISNPYVGDLTDPETGSPVTISREKDYGKLNKAIGRMQTPIADSHEKISEILHKMEDFDKIWRVPDDNYVQKVEEAAKLLDEVLANKASALPSVGNGYGHGGLDQGSSVGGSFGSVGPQPTQPQQPSQPVAQSQQTEPTASAPTPQPAQTPQQVAQKAPEPQPVQPQQPVSNPVPQPQQPIQNAAEGGVPQCFGNANELFGGYGSLEATPPIKYREPQVKKCFECPHSQSCQAKVHGNG